jgi:HEAT repeat protein
MAPIPPEQWASSREFEQGLAHTDSAERVRSIQVLVERKGDQALDEIQRALRDPDDQVRERALQAALDSSVPLPPLVLEGLVQNDPSPTVRFLALGAIVSGSAESLADDPRIRTVAELALNDPSPDVKEQAKQILEQLDYSAQPPDPEPAQGEEDAQ